MQGRGKLLPPGWKGEKERRGAPEARPRVRMVQKGRGLKRGQWEERERSISSTCQPTAPFLSASFQIPAPGAIATHRAASAAGVMPTGNASVR